MDYLLYVKPMRTFDGVVFARTRMGFSRYLRHHRTHYRIQERVYNYHCHLLEFKIEEQMEIEKIIELDKKFMALTTPEEREMIKYLAYHNPNESPPEHLHKSFESAYPKWYSVFYNESDPLFGKISPVLLGKEIEYLRVTNQYNKSELASMVGIDRTTLFDIEQGLRLPSVEILHRICVIFKIPIDYLLKMAIVRNVHDIPLKRTLVVKLNKD